MPNPPIKLVVGLGNPGREYEATRHNAGFWWIDALANTTRATLSKDAKFHAEIGKTGEVWLAKPATFMNLSGQAVGALAKFYRLVASEILIVHDELDLPPGSAKMKIGGGHGGHNGLKDIESHLGTREFWRLRLGIGHPREHATAPLTDVADYVLHRPSREEEQQIRQAMEKSLALWPLIEKGEMEKAMLRLHTAPAPSAISPIPVPLPSTPANVKKEKS